MKEAEFQNQIIELAHLYHWRVMHARPARTTKGWRTPIQGDRGFPDLVLAKNGCVIFWELKTDKGEPTPDQLAWLEALGESDERIQVGLRRPSDWDAIQLTLQTMGSTHC